MAQDRDVEKKSRRWNAPDAPGVYLMKDAAGRVIYVGKAVSLKKRIASYFHKPPALLASWRSPLGEAEGSHARGEPASGLPAGKAGKIQAMLEHLDSIEYIPTVSGAQALLRENILIKKYRPYYNFALKDDKSYPYVRVDYNEEYPAVVIVRHKSLADSARGEAGQGACCYGPYTDVKLLRAALKTIRRVLPFRSCRQLHKQPCLYYHLKLCPGVCAGKIERKQYREILRQLRLFLQGKYTRLLRQWEKMMTRAAGNEEYEQAALLRDRVGALNEIITQTRETGSCPVGNTGSYGVVLEQLKELLQLSCLPVRVEGYDISQIGGSAMTGALVSFLDGRPDKNHYRRFRIKTAWGGTACPPSAGKPSGRDDYAMIGEVLRRRFAQGEQTAFPDLIMIDGGKGHLLRAQRELQVLGINVPVMALAKRQETIWTPQGCPVHLPGDSRVLHLLQRIRDEAHRFARAYHHQIRSGSMRFSALDDIPGIGRKRKTALLAHFQSLEAIKQASLEDLLQVKGINRKTAEGIVRHFKRHCNSGTI